ncbi:MAG: hypothetical protein ABI646_02285 [Acidobacteriota bacterium]
MKYSVADWAEKRKRGIARYLMVDGILYSGGPFAVVMQVIGFFVLRDEWQTFGQYFSSTRTWVTFIAHGTLFGLVMGCINWWRNEKNAAGDNA